jgi:sugar lactone lactonase YvrE
MAGQGYQAKGGTFVCFGGMTMKTYREAELLLDARAELGESVLWRAESRSLCWADIVKCEVHTLRLPEMEHTHFITAQAVGAVVPAAGGGFAAALATGYYRTDDRGLTERITEPDGLVPKLRFNDGKCDRKGRFWAGTQYVREDMMGKGYFWCLDTDGSVRTVLTGITTSNGLAWNADDTVLYYIDTPTLTVMAYDFDLERGVLGEGKACITVPKEYGFPDGMTIDREGMLWIAHWEGSAVRRYNPRTGQCIGVLPVPASKVTCCCFGGDTLDTLYITTAREETDAAKEPFAGGIFQADVGAQGYEPYEYRGR